MQFGQWWWVASERPHGSSWLGVWGWQAFGDFVNLSYALIGMPSDASKLYGKNMLNFLQLITTKEGDLNLNFEDDLVKGTCVAHGGQITNERVAAAING